MTDPVIATVASDLDFTPLHERMQFYVDENILPCCMTLVMQHSDVIDFKTYGFMDLESRRPLADDAIFRVFSTSKLITSVAAMMLFEEGCFQIDDPISKYVPQLGNLTVLRPDAADLGDVEELTAEPTIGQLMSHSAGFSHGFLEPEGVIDQAYVAAGLAGLNSSIESLEDLVERLASMPLANQPGRRWRYSFSTDLLGRLIEIWSGERFGEFLKRRIFDPLGMRDTGFQIPSDQLDRFTAMYLPNDLMDPMQGGLTLMDDPYQSGYAAPPAYESGGHGLLSTVSDYLTFVRMLVNNGEWQGVRLVRPETLSLMRTNRLADGVNVQFGIELPGVTFGLGFALQEQVPDGMSALAQDEYHWGGIAGTHSWMAPNADAALICMTQRMPGFLHPFQADFKRLAYQALESA